MQFILLKEKQEAERNKIEAEGISSFQKIVTEGINENLLKWKGIEANKELALSGNSKVVIIGAGRDRFADHSWRRYSAFAGTSSVVPARPLGSTIDAWRVTLTECEIAGRSELLLCLPAL